ncbi:hypothetical protein BRADI_1g16195v3 [Brachypodium distachyon]|uniref:Uncharacterized protein n=1 Tax=Brachypodium distachyon TaxID=15368 RepID=A0A0Q3GU02_BRADI|nr:hypothetical protein BRADI_1g16195v3 [Brachypodium distachyon]
MPSKFTSINLKFTKNSSKFITKASNFIICLSNFNTHHSNSPSIYPISEKENKKKQIHRRRRLRRSEAREEDVVYVGGCGRKRWTGRPWEEEPGIDGLTPAAMGGGDERRHAGMRSRRPGGDERWREREETSGGVGMGRRWPGGAIGGDRRRYPCAQRG